MLEEDEEEEEEEEKRIGLKTEHESLAKLIHNLKDFYFEGTTPKEAASSNKNILI